MKRIKVRTRRVSYLTDISPSCPEQQTLQISRTILEFISTSHQTMLCIYGLPIATECLQIFTRVFDGLHVECRCCDVKGMCTRVAFIRIGKAFNLWFKESIFDPLQITINNEVYVLLLRSALKAILFVLQLQSLVGWSKGSSNDTK